MGLLPKDAVEVLRLAVQAALTILLVGRTGVGKTTLATAAALEIPEDERIVTVEAVRELGLNRLRPNCISLQARDANAEGAGLVTISDLLRKVALRQRPHRIIVGEVLDPPEALDFLHAVTSGHDGSLTTLHATNLSLALKRLELLALGAEAGAAQELTRHMVGSGIDVAVLLGKYREEGRWQRRMASLAFVDENDGDDAAPPIIQELCAYRGGGHWEWEPRRLVEMPRKIRDKLEMAGVDALRMRYMLEG